MSTSFVDISSTNNLSTFVFFKKGFVDAREVALPVENEADHDVAPSPQFHCQPVLLSPFLNDKESTKGNPTYLPVIL